MAYRQQVKELGVQLRPYDFTAHKFNQCTRFPTMRSHSKAIVILPESVYTIIIFMCENKMLDNVKNDMNRAILKWSWNGQSRGTALAVCLIP